MYQMKTKKDNSYLIILFACLASITAIACGSIYLKGQKKSDNNQGATTTEEKVLQNDYDHFQDEYESTTAYQTVMTKPDDNLNNGEDDNSSNNTASPDENDKKQGNSSDIEDDNTDLTPDTPAYNENDYSNDNPVDAQPVAAPAALPFNEEKTLFWPVDGNILLEYNMESTIYFPTLDVYKCNPALVIQSDVDTPVKSCTQSIVEEIGYQEEIGNYVTVSLGDGYKLTYGQLDKINVEEGQEVNASDVIGYIASPTKYYSKEGCNLYLKLTKDDTAIDPLDYLCYQ